MEIFIKTDKEIAAHSADYKKGLKTYSIGHNFFSDISQDEMSEYQGLVTDGINETPTTPVCSLSSDDEPDEESVPTSVDWRSVLNPIQNQG